MIENIILLFSLAFFCHGLTDENVAQEWKNFQEMTGKAYRSPVEASKRFAIFKDNLNEIEAHNKLYDEGLKTYKKGVTKFADWTTEEFMQYLSHFKMGHEKLKPKGVRVSKRNVSNKLRSVSLDWREKGRVSAVKDQGDCAGATWAFSVAGAIEGRARSYSNLRGLEASAQELLDCSTNSVCNNATVNDIESAYAYATRGFASADDYPYTGEKGSCTKQKEAASLLLTRVGYGEYEIQDDLSEYGPGSVVLQGTAELQHYTSGVLIDETCTDEINMAGLLVGYGNGEGDDTRIEYWIVKNSWGVNWGEDGYFRISRNFNDCGITSMGTFPELACNIRYLPSCI